MTGYLLSGILFGPFVLGAIVDHYLKQSDALGLHVLFGSPLSGATPLYPTLDISWLSGVALAFIAFTIGQSFDKNALRQTGKRILVTAFTESLGGSLAVLLGLTIAHFIAPNAFPWPIVLTLSAIASATAPAATVLVIKQYRAHGFISLSSFASITVEPHCHLRRDVVVAPSSHIEKDVPAESLVISSGVTIPQIKL